MSGVALFAGIDWTQVLLYGVPAYIAAIGGAIAAILGQINRRNTKTSNGKTLAQAVESTHKAVSENADAIDGLSSHTKTPDAPAVPGL